MKKKTFIILLSSSILASCISCFYMFNLILSDVSNMFYGVHDVNFISSIPGFIFSLDLVLLVLFLIRLKMNEEYKLALEKFYVKFLLINSIIGFITSILTATIVYKSLFKPYPFPLYTLLSLIFNILLIVFSVLFLYKTKDNEIKEDGKRKITFLYAILSITIFGFLYYTFNRFGALIWSVTYMNLSTFFLTLPFYLSLSLPFLFFIHTLKEINGVYDQKMGKRLIISVVLLIITITLQVTVIMLGINSTRFISLVSPAMPIERLMTAPIGIIFQTIFLLLYSLFFVGYSFKKYKK